MRKIWVRGTGLAYLLLGMFFIVQPFTGLTGLIIGDILEKEYTSLIGIVFFICGTTLLFISIKLKNNGSRNGMSV